MTKKLGRPPALEAMKDHNIRMTDRQWQIFKEYLGPKWLRDQIDKASKSVKPTSN